MAQDPAPSAAGDDRRYGDQHDGDQHDGDQRNADRDGGDAPIDPAIAMLAGDGVTQALGMELLEARAGYARIAMVIDEQMLNGHGIGHGGYVFLLADTAFGAASNSGRSMTVAASATVDFLAPVRAGDRLVAEGVERVHNGRNGITDVTVWRDGPQPVRVAEFRGRSRTLAEPAIDPATSAPQPD